MRGSLSGVEHARSIALRVTIQPRREAVLQRRLGFGRNVGTTPLPLDLRRRNGVAPVVALITVQDFRAEGSRSRSSSAAMQSASLAAGPARKANRTTAGVGQRMVFVVLSPRERRSR